MSCAQGQARSDTGAGNDNKKTKEKWLCDICKEVSFDTFEEACRHEEACAAAMAMAGTGDGAVAAAETSDDGANASANASSDTRPTCTERAAIDTENIIVDENIAADINSTTKPGTGSEAPEVETEAEPPKAKPKGTQKVVYLCDFCQVAQFESYEEACRHENSCSLRRIRRRGAETDADADVAKTKNSNGDDMDTTGADTPNPKALAAIFSSPRPTQSTASGSSAGTVGASSSKRGATERKRGAYTGGGNGDKKVSPGTALLREHKAAEVSAKFAAERKRKREEERERKRKREAVVAAAEVATGNRSTGAAANNVVGIFARQLKKSHGQTLEHTDFIDLVEADSVKGASTSRARTRGAATTARVALENTCKDDSSKTLTFGTAGGKASAFPLAPRFPTPTHLIGGDDSTMAVIRPVYGKKGGKGRNDDCPTVPGSSCVFVSTRQVDIAANTLISSARHHQGGANQRQGKPDLSSNELPLTCTDNRVLPACTSPTTIMQAVMHPDEDLARTIALVMSPPPVSIVDDAEPSNELWSSKYGICHVPGDVCGDTNKESAKELMAFICEWKAHRADFVKKMEEKHRSLGSQKRRKTKKGGSGRSYYEDDLWSDTDEEDLGLCNIFLLNGPHGTGKSALVHAAARQSGCVLLEINTTEKRGGSALKRAIEECTQSHSSLALLKRGGSATALGEVGAFSESNCSADLGNLCGEADGDYGFSDKDDDDEDNVDRGRLAIILIDEVDNIFESDGDAGFWVALASLSEKAKCPIVLTSSETPILLEASSIRYHAASLCRPTPVECASTIRRIALEEKVLISGRDDDGGDRDALLHIAELCSCDLRSILNAMQLHCHGSLSAAEAKVEKRNCSEGEEESLGRASSRTCQNLDFPEILNVSPSIVDGDRHSVLTIRGQNFVGTNKWDSIQILIGGRPSPLLRVVDDTTILAISPPCHLPGGVDPSGIFEMTFEPCITSRHLPIDVIGTTRTGLVAHSDSVLVSAPGKRWNVAYSFPEPPDRLEDLCNKREITRENKRRGEAFSSSDDEDDFVIPTSTRKANEEKEANDGLGKETIVTVVSMASDNDAPAPGHNADLAALLEKASYDLVLQDQDVAIKRNDAPRASLKLDPLGEKMEVKSGAADSKDNHYGDEKVALELEQLVRELENSSDASFLQEGIRSMAMPMPSGSIRGFSYDFIDQQSSAGPAGCSKTSSTSAPKNLRTTSARPPSLEKIFVSGWNESSFFFGAPESYLTLPATRAERIEISNALAYPIPDRCAVCNDNAKNDPGDSTGTKSSSLSSNWALDVSEDSIDGITATYDSNSFVRPESCNPIFELPSLLRGRIQFPLRDKLALLTTRKAERSMLLFSTSSTLFQDVAMSSSFCFGLVEPSNENLSGMLFDLDHRMNLDYLPFLKAMSVAEDNADRRYLAATEEINAGALGLQVGNIGRRSTRRTAKVGREHYFNRVISGQGLRYEEARICAKQISEKLSKEMLHY